MKPILKYITLKRIIFASLLASTNLVTYKCSQQVPEIAVIVTDIKPLNDSVWGYRLTPIFSKAYFIDTENGDSLAKVGDTIPIKQIGKHIYFKIKEQPK